MSGLDAEPMTAARLVATIRADAHRYGGGLLRLFALERVFRHTIAMRVDAFLASRDGMLARLVRAPVVVYRYRARTLGYDVSPLAQVGEGLYVAPHPGGVVVHPEARIGRNCNLHHGVTIGRKHRGPHAGTPSIGDDVWIGPGAKLVGAITVGDGAVIGPNCVISDDLPAGAVVAAPRPELLSGRGSAGYVERHA